MGAPPAWCRTSVIAGGSQARGGTAGEAFSTFEVSASQRLPRAPGTRSSRVPGRGAAAQARIHQERTVSHATPASRTAIVAAQPTRYWTGVQQSIFGHCVGWVEGRDPPYALRARQWETFGRRVVRGRETRAQRRPVQNKVFSVRE